MKKILTLTLALLGGVASLSAQETAAPGKRDRQALKFGKTITPEDARKHLSVLASDEYEGRNTGEKGGHMAAEYIAGHFRKLGLKGPVDGSYYQQVDLVKQHINNKVFLANRRVLTFMEDFLFFPDLQKLELDATSLVFAGYGIGDDRYNDYADLDVQGKVVMILPGEPFGPDSISYVSGTREFSSWSQDQQKKLDLLKEKGATAILMVTKSIETYAKNYRNYFSGSSMQLRSDLENQEAKPALHYISQATADSLLAPSSLYLRGIQRQIASSGKPVSKQSNMS